MERRIAVANPALVGNELAYVEECLRTEWISSIGAFINRFESAFASFCEVPHAASTNNGTTALHVLLDALGVGPGDEVIVPTLTYVATANAVRYLGATPVFADADRLTMNLDPDDIEHRITPRTKGIIAVHLYGVPADMDRINAIARRHGLFCIEDAAEAPGATYQGRMVGSLADAASFSFFGNKTITTGEGGMVTTADPELDARIRLLKGQGMDPQRRYWFPVVGYNYRMTNVQAAIGLAQLEKIDFHLGRRQEVAARYQDRLAKAGDLLALPSTPDGSTHTYWLYTVVLGDDVTVGRDDLMALLAADGIESRPVFYPMHVLPPHRTDESFPVAERLSARGISLPTHARLSDDDVDYVAERVLTHLGVLA